MRAKGFEPIVAGRGSKYPGLGIGEDETVGTWRWEEPGKGMVWVTLHAWYNGGPDAPWSDLTIVETKAMQQTLEANAATEARAATLADALQQSGHVAIYGITFDFTRRLRPRPPRWARCRRCCRAMRSCRSRSTATRIDRPAGLQSSSADRAAAVNVAGGARHRRSAPCHAGLATKPVEDNATERAG